jgi:hypothetical protein
MRRYLLPLGFIAGSCWTRVIDNASFDNSIPLIVIAPLGTYFVRTRTTIPPAGVAIEARIGTWETHVSEVFISARRVSSITYTSPGAVQVVDRAVGVILLSEDLHLFWNLPDRTQQVCIASFIV